MLAMNPSFPNNGGYMFDRLRNKKIAILVTDGFEKVELSFPRKALEAQGADVHILSLHSGKIRSMNLHKPANKFKVDRVLRDVKPEEYDGLFIPGGFINPDLLRQSEEVRSFVKAFDELKRPIASLCHGPWVLASSGILGSRTITSWPGLRDDMVNAGATWLNENVVSDGNIVTSRGPQDLPFFIPKIIELFENGAVISEANNQIEDSAPQATDPPQLVQKTISLVSGFPFKWAAIAGLACLGIYGALTKKGMSFQIAR